MAALNGQGQNPYFNRALNIPGIQGYLGTTVLQNQFVCHGESVVGGNVRRLLVKYDLNGDSLFHVEYYLDSATSFTTRYNSSILQFDSSLYFLGLDEVFGSYKATITRHTINGDTLWKKDYGLPGEGDVECIVLCDDSALIAAGTYEANPTSDIWLMKLDSDGNILWSNIYPTLVTNERSTSVHLTESGEILIGGLVSSGSYDALLIKFDSLGAMKWQRTFGGTDSDNGRALVISDTSYLLYGRMKNVSAPGVGDEAFAYLLDSSGNVKWEYYFQTVSNSVLQEFVSAEVTTDGVVLVGVSYSPSTNNPLGTMIKLDQEGNQLWKRLYKLPDRTNDHYFRDIDILPDSGFILSGWVFPDNGFTQDGWIVRTNCIGYDTVPRADFQAYNLGANLAEFYNTSHYAEQYHWDFGDGNTYTHWSDPADTLSSEPFLQHQYAAAGLYNVTLCAIACNDTTTHSMVINVSPNSIQERTPGLFSIYPNPTNGEFVVTIDEGSVGSNTTLEIYTADGRLVESIDISGNDQRIKINLSDTQPGIYFVSLSINGNVLKTERLVNL